MLKQKRIIIIFSLVFISGITFSQISKDLFLSLNAQNQNKIKRAEEMFQQGFNGIDNAIDFYEKLPDNKDSIFNPKYEALLKSALSKLRMASDNFGKASELAFDVYSEGINEFWKNHNIKFYYTDGVMEAINMQKEGRNCFELSQQIREAMIKEKDFTHALSKHNIAYKLEIIALTYTARALKRYQDFPVDYNYRWGNNFTFKEWHLKQKQTTETANTKNQTPIINLQASDEIIKTDTIKTIEEIAASDALHYVVFRVQIAAHTNKISSKALTSIYDGKRKVIEIQEDGWYKYQIGAYRSFAEAYKVLQEINIDKAFIAAYDNGKKISVKTAKELAP